MWRKKWIWRLVIVSVLLIPVPNGERYTYGIDTVTGDDTIKPEHIYAPLGLVLLESFSKLVP